MVKVTRGSLLDGIHGKFGKDLIFRDSNGQTIASNVSGKKVKATDKRLVQQAKFKAISPLAKEAIADPVKRARYESLREIGQTAYNVAFSELYEKYFPGGEIAGNKKKRRARKIRPKAVKGRRVKDITLVITTAKNTFIESGVIPPDAYNLDWLFTLAQSKTTEPVHNIVAH